MQGVGGGGGSGFESCLLFLSFNMAFFKYDMRRQCFFSHTQNPGVSCIRKALSAIQVALCSDLFLLCNGPFDRSAF